MSQVNQILSQIKAEVDRPAVSATRVDDDTKWPPFSYTDDEAGQTLDITGLNERICAMVDTLESGVVDLTPVPVEATVTRAQLEAQIVKLSSYETTVGKTGDYVESRTENIRIGTERFNHLIIRAGESVSFNKVALKRTEANGYQPALEIAYGSYVQGIGGGICQVSSTLYNAVVNAGLTVNKRTPHAIPSSYVEKGKDATVSDDRYDFVFTNNTGANIYIDLVEFDAYNLPNEALNSGDIDLNAFQHKAYLAKDCSANGYDLTVIGDTLIAPLCIYSEKYDSIDAIKEAAGAK